MKLSTIDYGIWDNADLGGERYETRVAKAENAGLDFCQSCGKGLKDGSGVEVLVVGGGAELLAVADWDRYEDAPRGFWGIFSGGMGMFSVGSDCAKEIPAAFKSRRTSGKE